MRIAQRIFLSLYLTLGIFLAMSMAIGSQLIGIANDEYIHMLDLGDWRWASTPGNKHFGVYGLSFQLLSHSTAVVTGIESLGVVGFTEQSFMHRHLLVTLLAVLAAVTVGVIVWFITRQIIWAVWGSAALLAIPVFAGQGMFNPKDIPVACGYTLVTAGLVGSLINLNFKWPRAFQDVVLPLMIFVGFWLSVGTRLALLYPLLLTAALVTGFISIYGWFERAHLKIFAKRIWPLAIGFLAGIVSVLITSPCVVAPSATACESVFQPFFESVRGSTAFPDNIPTFIAGQVIQSVDVPFWSIPLALFIGTPLGIFLLALCGAVFYAENPSFRLGSYLHGFFRPTPVLFACVGVIALQASLVPLYVIFSRSSWYDLQRQHLYVYPALAALAALGICVLYRWAQNISGRMIRETAKAGIMAVSMIFLAYPAYETAKLWPYNYLYVNELATIPRGFTGTWETDYMFVSDREALQGLPGDVQFRTAGDYWTLKPFLDERGARQPLSGDGAEGGRVPVVYTYRYGIGQRGLEDICDVRNEVTREFRGEMIVLSAVYSCPTEVETGISFDDLMRHEP